MVMVGDFAGFLQSLVIPYVKLKNIDQVPRYLLT